MAIKSITALQVVLRRLTEVGKSYHGKGTSWMSACVEEVFVVIK